MAAIPVGEAPSRRALRVVVLAIAFGVATPYATAQERPPGAEAARAEPRIELEDRLPPAALAPIGSLNFRGADLRDVLRALAAESGLNLIVDDRVDARVTVNLQDLAVIDALQFLAEENGLSLVQTGSIFRVRVPPPPPPAAPPPPEVPRVFFQPTPPGSASPGSTVGDLGVLSADLDGADLRAVARRLTEVSGVNVVLREGVSGTLTGYLESAPFEAGLRTLLETNGLTLERDGDPARGGFYLVGRAFRAEEGRPSGAFVREGAGGISLRLRDADVAEAVREIARQSPVPVVTYTLPQGRTVTASADGLSVEQALRVVLRGTNTTFRRESAGSGADEGAVYLVGSQAEDGLVTSRLLRLGYVQVEGLLELVPPRIRERASVQVVPEQNALLVSGTNDAVAELEAFLAEVDYPAPQVLIETLVVDLLDTDFSELGFDFGRGLLPGLDTLENAPRVQPRDYDFRGTTTGVLEVTGSGRDVNNVLARDGDLFGLGGIGVLPADFYFRVRALEQEGRVAIRSRPQVATLSGNTASISIGTTQYFLLETATPITAPNDVFVQETQRFEQIEANVSLEITPYVSPYGEVTALIRPSFATPVGEFTSGVPPTIATREIEARVRLRDGETIILGGLISDEDVVTDRKIPILGDLPLIGRLFRSRTRSKQSSELVIYITPHVFYGDGRDRARWRSLADSLELDYSPLVPPDPSLLERIWPFDDDGPVDDAERIEGDAPSVEEAPSEDDASEEEVRSDDDPDAEPAGDGASGGGASGDSGSSAGSAARRDGAALHERSPRGGSAEGSGVGRPGPRWPIPERPIPERPDSVRPDPGRP